MADGWNENVKVTLWNQLVLQLYVWKHTTYKFVYLQYAFFYWPIKLLSVAECCYASILQKILFFKLWPVLALESEVHFLSGGFIQALAHWYFYKRKGEQVSSC